jgi:hypothetical protein
MEHWRQMVNRACADVADPAEVFAVSFRISGRLGWTRPDVARFLAGRGLDLVNAPAGLVPRALRDIVAGQAAGRFTIPDAAIVLSAVAGGLLGLLLQLEHDPERSTRPSSTSSPQACCACSASPRPKPRAWQPSRCERSAPGSGVACRRAAVTTSGW